MRQLLLCTALAIACAPMLGCEARNTSTTPSAPGTAATAPVAAQRPAQVVASKLGEVVSVQVIPRPHEELTAVLPKSKS